MDKRKLSAIPRDEATADMLDVANGLENIGHIVTARLIEDNKILLLNFYEVSTLKKGKTEAAFRTFLSEDDYITQDLEQSKVKWLTSSFYNMNAIQICEDHWNPQKHEYDREDKILIHSDEDLKIIADFFEKYREVNSKSNYSWPEPWRSVKKFQDTVRERKVEARHKKELEPVDAAMKPFKEPPKAFFDWMWETGMSFSRYVIYKEVKSGQAECECTHCKTVGTVSRAEIRLRNNEKGECPFCGSRVTFKARGRMELQQRDERWFIYVDSTSDGFALRYFNACRILRSDSFIEEKLTKPRLKEWSHEFRREIYSFQGGHPESEEDYEWDVYKQRGSSRWCPSTGKYARRESILYPGNLPKAWEHTPMKYSALEILSANIPTVGLNYKNGITTYIKFPKLEWLCKMGLNNLAKGIINNGYYSPGRINYEGKTIYDILGLTKVNTRIMQEIDGNNEELRLLQVAQTVGIQFKPEQLRAYYRTFKCNTELLKQANRKVSLHKLVKYIAKESEKYPMGKRGGCWMYSCHRYHEREDPRIERQQNMAKDWLEYLEWCKKLKYDLNNKFIYMPKNFKAVHDRTAGEYQALQDKKAAAEKARREREAKCRMAEIKKAMEEILSNNKETDAFLIKWKELILVVPKSGDEIRREGAALHHCVGGYVEKVARGETNIFFVRKADNPDEPYFTLEWKNNDIVQCRGLNNCGMPPEVKAFTQAFKKKMLAALKKKEKTDNAGKPKRLRSA